MAPFSSNYELRGVATSQPTLPARFPVRSDSAGTPQGNESKNTELKRRGIDGKRCIRFEQAIWPVRESQCHFSVAYEQPLLSGGGIATISKSTCPDRAVAGSHSELIGAEFSLHSFYKRLETTEPHFQ